MGSGGRAQCGMVSRHGVAVKRALSWLGFALILAVILPALPWTWAGLAILALFCFVFAPRE